MTKNYKEAQQFARDAQKSFTMVHDSGRQGTFDPGIRSFKQGFKLGLLSGMVTPDKGAISSEIAKFKGKAWDK